jgi:2-dehydro-3-deoxyphosphogluconate aldolase / (4S)-4-hydroxy-2-oxoglutarate aldolase
MGWLELLQKQRSLAVIRAPQLEIGRKMALAVAAGGMQLIEITWNSDRAPELIAQLRTELPDCTIGCGTLLEANQMRAAIAAGSQFLFTPHVNPSLIQIAVDVGIPIVPGTLTPTEIVTAWQAGATCVKVFPIAAVGGANYIKNLQAPLGNIPLIPTGGVTLDNAKDFIAAGAIAVGLCGELFPKHLVATEDWHGITALARSLGEKLRPLTTA